MIRFFQFFGDSLGDFSRGQTILNFGGYHASEQAVEDGQGVLGQGVIDVHDVIAVHVLDNGGGATFEHVEQDDSQTPDIAAHRGGQACAIREGVHVVGITLRET